MIIGRKINRCITVLVLGLFVGFAPAAEFDVAELSHAIKQHKTYKVNFIQKQRFEFSSKPIISSGYFYYRSPDYLEQTIVQPQQRRFISSGKWLIVKENGKVITKTLKTKMPAVATMISVLTTLLSGNIAMLKKEFTLQASGEQANWLLSLTPHHQSQGGLDFIQVNGAYGFVQAIAMHYNDGRITSVMLSKRVSDE